jgi:hypothetical protein
VWADDADADDADDADEQPVTILPLTTNYCDGGKGLGFSVFRHAFRVAK